MNLLRKIDEERCIDLSVQSNRDLFIEIFIQNKHRETTNDVQILNILGAYYYCIHNDHEKALEYWILASEKSCVQSMVNIGNYYMEIVGDYGRGLHWFLMAIETNNDTQAMISLGNYYLNIEMNHEKAFEYYAMAHKSGKGETLVYMCNYYCVKNDTWCAEKYAELAYNLGYRVYVMKTNDFVRTDDSCPEYKPMMCINTTFTYDVITQNIAFYKNKGNEIVELCFIILKCIKKNMCLNDYVNVQKILENINYHFDNYTINFYLDKCIEMDIFGFLPILINRCAVIHDNERMLKYCKNVIAKYSMMPSHRKSIVVNYLKLIPIDVILRTFEYGDFNVEIFIELMDVLEHSTFLIWKMLYTQGCPSALENIMKKLETNVEVHIFKNKIIRAKRYSTLNDCPICLSKNVLCIEMWCGHEICTNCYNPNMKCYLRCNDVFKK